MNTAEILCHPQNDNTAFQKSVEGVTLAVLAFSPSFALGSFLASRCLSSSMAEIAPIAQTIEVCFGVWSMYLFYDLHRSASSLKRLLLWGSVIGGTMGYLSFSAMS